MDGVSTVFFKYGLMLIFCVFGVGSQNFLLQNFSNEVDFGGIQTESLNVGGSTDVIGQKWLGSACGARR